MQIKDLTDKEIVHILRQGLFSFFVETFNRNDESLTISSSCTCEKIGNCDQCDIQQVINSIINSLDVKLSDITVNGWDTFLIKDSGCETCGHNQIPNECRITVKISLEKALSKAALRHTLYLTGIHRESDERKKRVEQKIIDDEARRKNKEKKEKKLSTFTPALLTRILQITSEHVTSMGKFAALVENLSPADKALAFAVKKFGVEEGVKRHIAKYGENSVDYRS